MPTGPEVLALVRTQPDVAFHGFGLITRGAPLGQAEGGQCTLICDAYNAQPTGVYVVTVAVHPVGPDWFIPFAPNQARYCDVPAGQPDGTLVVTFPMNGCALEVHALPLGGNRFYHDSDGNSMPVDAGPVKYRATSQDYSGPDEKARHTIEPILGPDFENTGGFEHNLFCIKTGDQWQVYASAVIRLNGFAWQVKGGVPIQIGAFPD